MSAAAGGPDPTVQTGRVLASHGSRALVEQAGGGAIPCSLTGRKLQVVCGDEVRWVPTDRAGEGRIVERLPRRSTLTRSNAAGTSEVVVANVTQLVIMFASRPRPDFFVVDRYLAAAEAQALRGVAVLNKSDVADSDAECERELACYARIGYATLACSALSGDGLDPFAAVLRGQVSVLVGQSGVGKSTLANRLLPGLEARTAELSRATTEGTHATSVATLHHLPAGGDLIDSPGVRDFAPGLEQLSDATHAFREFREPATRCRFKDCRHLREPDCAVRAAVEAGEISERRYESYRRLSRLRERLAPGHAPRSR